MATFNKAAVYLGDDLPILLDVSALRNYSPRYLVDGAAAIVTGGGIAGQTAGFYTWSETSTEVDDGDLVISNIRFITGRWKKVFGAAIASVPTDLIGSRAAIPFLSISDALLTIRTNGYYNVGDGGGATYRRVPADLGFNTSVRDANGQWWALAEGSNNVRQYGARGDGSDDLPAIQAAIDYAASKGGGEVRVPSGTFTIDYRLRNDTTAVFGLEMKSYIRFVGAGKETTVIRVKSNAYGLGPGSIVRTIMSRGIVTDIALENFTLDGNMANQPTLQDGTHNGGNILLGGFDNGVPNNILINNVKVVNSYAQAIQCYGLDSNVARNIRITNCDVINASYIGIQVSRATDVEISGNYLTKTKDNAIDVYGDKGTADITTHRLLIKDNRIFDCERGVFPETVAHVTVMGNTISKCDIGIHCNQIVGAPNCILLTNNLIDNCRAPMVFSGAFNSVMVNDNIIDNFTYAAFTIGFTGGQCAGIFFDNNVVWPASNNVPIFFTPPGTQFASYIKFGRTYLVERNASQPTPAFLNWVNNAQGGTGNSFPVVISLTNASSDRPEYVGDYVYLGNPTFGRPSITNVPVYANNQAARNAGLPGGTIYVQTAGGPLYYVT